MKVFFWNIGEPCQEMQSNDDHQSIVISGGYESGDTSTVEFFSPDNILHCQCSLPSLPKTRHGHTMDGLTVCGGRDDDWVQNDDCITLGLRGWETSHTLSQERAQHVAWRRDNGLMLMGGEASGTRNTTEMAGQDGSVTNGPFGLKYPTRQVIKMKYFLVIFLLSSNIANMFIN